MKKLFKTKTIVSFLLLFSCAGASAMDVAPAMKKIVIIRASPCAPVLHIANGPGQRILLPAPVFNSPFVVNFSKQPDQRIDLNKLEEEIDRSQESMSRMDPSLVDTDANERKAAEAILKDGIKP